MGNNGDWTEVNREELRRIVTRRSRIRHLGWGDRLAKNRTGLALSGGGIRSATFSLGLMKSLSNAELIHSIDYISTVSGGGYAGSFYCSLFVPQDLRGSSPPAKDTEAAVSEHPQKLAPDVLGCGIGRDALAHLRQGGHYLAPNGTSDALFAAVIALRNWFAVAVVAGLALLFIFLLLNLFVDVLHRPVSLLLSDILTPRTLTSEAARATDTTPHGLPFDRAALWMMILGGLSFWPASCAWAYWFARSGRVPVSRLARPFSMQTVVAASLAALAWFIWPTPWEGWHKVARTAIVLTAALALLLYIAAELDSYVQEKKAGAKPASDCVEAYAQEDTVRHTLSRWLFRGIFVLAIVGAFAAIQLISDFNFWAARQMTNPLWIIGATFGAIFAVVVASRLLLQQAGVHGESSWISNANLRTSRRLLSLAGGLILLFLYLKFWANVASRTADHIHNLVDGGKAEAMKLWGRLPDLLSQIFSVVGVNVKTDPHQGALILGFVTVCVGIIAYLAGNVDALLNRSSLAAFYSGRLRAAYLGATNRDRWEPQMTVKPGEESIDREDPRDEITLGSYYDERLLTPLHLINVTINETTSRSSRVIQRDRKGKSMTIAPTGYLYPPGSPSQGLSRRKRGEAEDLPLSAWMAISGAAFSSGAGHQTTLGTAMLATLTNMRLGYWWESERKQFRWLLRSPSRSVQRYLLRELRADYEGTGESRWYLTDGGHYENTGVYELVRRRVPFIIASDNGADPRYEFSDLVSLIRKLRIDFEAEVEFLDRSEIDALFGRTPLEEVFGTLDQIRDRGEQALRAAANPKARQPKAGPYATLARIRYLSPEDVRKDHNGQAILDASGKPCRTRDTTLLLIKPRVTGNELPDLVQYRETNAAFPQQPTTNQFFDEAQWESYYRLGQLIGDRIFDYRRFDEKAAVQPRWKPWEMKPLPPEPARAERQLDLAIP